MNKSVFSSIFLFWAFVCMCTFWVRYSDLSQKFLSLSPLWIVLLVMAFIALIVYIIFFRTVKEITISTRPITLLGLFLLVLPVVFFLEYSHVVGYFSSLFQELGVEAKNIPTQLAEQFGLCYNKAMSAGRVMADPSMVACEDAVVNLFSAGSVFVRFMEKYMSGVFSVIVLIFGALGAGLPFRMLLSSFVEKERYFLQVLAGCAVLCLVLFVLGWMGVFTSMTLWILVAVLIVLGIVFEGKGIWSILTTKTSRVYSLEGAVAYWVSGGLLAVVVGLSFLHLLRPMPIGWDDITLYMNLPSLTAHYHHLVSGFGTYSWGLVMAMGYSLFGNATFAMIYSFVGGLLALWGIYVLLSRIETQNTKWPLALLLTMVFVSAPFFQFQFSEDMKVDLALTAFGAGAMLLMLEYLKAETHLRERGILLVLGILLGSMLGIKFTALIFFFFAAVVVAWKYGKTWLAASVVCLFTAFLFAGNIISIGGIVYPSEWLMPTAVIALLVGIGLIVVGYLKNKETWRGIKALFMIAVLGFGVFAPWLAFNALSFCDVTRPCTFQGFSGMLYGKPFVPTLVPKEVKTGLDTPPEAVELKKVLVESGGSQKEELQRYRGFDKGLFAYATLPVDVTMGTNERGDYITIGWVFLAVLPLVFFPHALTVKESEDSRYKKIKKAMFVLAFFALFNLVLSAFSEIFIRIYGFFTGVSALDMKLASVTIESFFTNLTYSLAPFITLSRYCFLAIFGYLFILQSRFLWSTDRKNTSVFIFISLVCFLGFTLLLSVLLGGVSELITFFLGTLNIQYTLPYMIDGSNVLNVFLISVLVFVFVYSVAVKTSEEGNKSIYLEILIPATLLYWFAWSYLANGVIWYGILGFLPLLLLALLGLEKLHSHEKDWFLPYVFLILVFWIVPMYTYKITVNDVQVPRLGTSWKTIVEQCEATKITPSSAQVLAATIQTLVKKNEDQTAVAKACSLYRDQSISKADFENIARGSVAEIIGQSYGMPDSLTFLLFKAGILQGEEDTMAQMNAPYATAIKEIRKIDPSVKIYRVGTFMPYYTPQNDQRMLTDNQLDIFMNYYLPEMDKKAFVKTLKDSGIGYIVYDNRTQTIDKTPQQTLTKKVELFIDFVKGNDQLERIVGTGDPSLDVKKSPDTILVYKLL